MFDFYNSLGARSYYVEEGSVDCFPSLAECVVGTNTKEIDATAILSVLMKNYIVGSRTLIKGVNRTPWMSKLNRDGEWITSELPKHGMRILGPEAASEQLYKYLRDEIVEFIVAKKTIGILLSGGMDSRIVAGVVRQLQEEGIYSGDVVALTWGVSNSRDVLYAERIAVAFGWNFEKHELNPEGLARNIELTAERGAEYSPVHLHAMESISKINGLDGILAGSYGDSIGRGEYSGRRTDKLPDILSKHLNHFSLLLKSVEDQALKKIKDDLLVSRQFFPSRSEASYREVEMQMHYMRRQLNACMEVIDDKIPLYQVFGSPDTFGFMWSLDAKYRNDDVYEHLLHRLPAVLRDIPWARTGKKYNQNNLPKQDAFTSLNNNYGKWLRNDLREYVLGLINNGALQDLGIFNERSLNMWCNYWSKSNDPKADRLDEKMAWLASLSIFTMKYDVKSVGENHPFTLADSFSQIEAYLHTNLYHLALKIKK